MTKYSSCLYEGYTIHTRNTPKHHKFTYDLFMTCLDLDEIENECLECWPLFSSKRKFSVFMFDRHDHKLLSENKLESCKLSEHVQRKVRESIGTNVNGKVRLLTHLRCFGICFNPVSFYYISDPHDTKTEVIIAEVGNIPWLEQHLYFLKPSSDEEDPDKSENSKVAGLRLFGQHDKNFHVSPFIHIKGVSYKWHFSEPSENLHVLNQLQDSIEGKFFSASLSMVRNEWTKKSLLKYTLLYPLLTLRVMWLIHYEAFQLYLKKFPFYSHPEGTETRFSKAIAVFMAMLGFTE